MKKDHGISRSLGYYYYTTVFWENRAERMFGFSGGFFDARENAIALQKVINEEPTRLCPIGMHRYMDCSVWLLLEYLT